MVTHVRHTLVLLLLLLAHNVRAQMETTASDTVITDADIALRMLQFQQELNQLYLLSADTIAIDKQNSLTPEMVADLTERLKKVRTSLKAFSTRWNTYSQAQQVYVAENDSLLNLTAEIQQLQQAVADSLDLREQAAKQLDGFLQAERFIMGQDTVYQNYYSQAMQLSLSAKLASLLQKVKTSEQMLTTQLSASYAQAKEAAGAFPVLAPRMEALDDKYLQLMGVSAKIQEAAYKPLIQRIKDYLLGFAAVAILLMFVNLAIARFNSMKKLRDQAMKLKQMAGGKQDEYPTI